MEEEEEEEKEAEEKKMKRNTENKRVFKKAMLDGWLLKKREKGGI